MLAHETVPHLPSCLASSSVAIQLSACYVVEALQQNPHARRALDKRDVATQLVKLNERQHALSTGPAIRCIGHLCELSRDNADAVVRANGLHAMLSTLEDDCPAQVRLAPVCGVPQRKACCRAGSRAQTARRRVTGAPLCRLNGTRSCP